MSSPVSSPSSSLVNTDPTPQSSPPAYDHPSGLSSLSPPAIVSVASAIGRRAASSSFGFLGALGHTFHGIVDVDPEATRRSSIGKTKDAIAQLEEALAAATGDLRYASQTIQADLDRFQRQKVADLKSMCLEFAKLHREWCVKNLDQWEQAKSEITKVTVHPAS